MAVVALAGLASADPVVFRVDRAHTEQGSQVGPLFPRLEPTGSGGSGGHGGYGPRSFGDTYDNEVQLMDIDFMEGRYLWDGLGGQSVQYTGTPHVVGSTFFDGRDVSAFSSETDLGGGLFHITLGVGMTGAGEMIPAGLTLPSGEGMRSIYWQVGGGGIGDRDGSADGFNPFPMAPAWDLLDGTISGYSGSTLLFSFAGSGVPALGLTDVDLYAQIEDADGMGLTYLQLDLTARPVPAPGAMLVIAMLGVGRRRRG